MHPTVPAIFIRLGPIVECFNIAVARHTLIMPAVPLFLSRSLAPDRRLGGTRWLLTSGQKGNRDEPPCVSPKHAHRSQEPCRPLWTSAPRLGRHRRPTRRGDDPGTWHWWTRSAHLLVGDDQRERQSARHRRRGLWADGTFWFETGERTRKGKNLARDPRCSLSLATHEFDLVVEGTAEQITDPPTVASMAQRWSDQGGPARVDESGVALTAEFSAPSVGPPPWVIYRVTIDRATAIRTVEPRGATQWTMRSS